jgi:hypothetical protein
MDSHCCRFIYKFLLALFCVGTSHAQELRITRNFDNAKLFPVSDTIFLDSTSFVPGSVKIKQKSGEHTDLSFIEVPYKGYIILNSIPGVDSILISFQPLGFSFARRYIGQDWTPNTIDRPRLPEEKEGYFLSESKNPNHSRDWLENNSDLQRSGSLSRGIAFGNGRDASLQSAFNLQLSGMLGDGIEINAAITDDNIPIQPDGNTLQLQDFDQIFVTLSKGKNRLTAGDFVIAKPKSHFLNLQKRGQGILIEANVPNATLLKNLPTGNLSVSVAGAIARGKFKRQTFNGAEGNQGPYRLTGNENEAFILMLSGSETVYLDGDKMERGINADYIIDYNSAELSFMPKRMITKDSRIVVEFEYSDRNYQRWMANTGIDWSLNKSWIRFNYFTEFDDKNTPIFQTLSDSDRVTLTLAGDNSSQMNSPGFKELGFSEEEIRYRKVDTLIYGNQYSIFIFSQDPEKAVWRVKFSFVGIGKGNYELASSVANGRVYQFIEPDSTGSPRGSFSPEINLVPPQQQHMLTLASGTRFGKYWYAEFEGALSHFDRNTFSPLDTKDNQDYAFKSTLKYRKGIPAKGNDSIIAIAIAQYEQNGAHFKPFFRFRPVEFERDWNILNNNNPNQALQRIYSGNDHIGHIAMGIKKGSQAGIEGSSDFYIKGNNFSGLRPGLSWNFKNKLWNIRQEFNVTLTEDSLIYSRFIRQKIRLESNNKWFKTGIYGENEVNEQGIKMTDSLLQSAYAFHDYKIYFAQNDSSILNWQVHYRIRSDFVALNNQGLASAALAHHAGASFEIIARKGHKFGFLGQFRALNIPNASPLNLSPDQTILTRADYSGSWMNEAIKTDVFWETGSGLENQREYQFIPALNGLGDYIWLDYNGNGLKERDEFELRNTSSIGSDGFTYIKVFVPGNRYTKAFFSRLTANLTLKTPASWKTASSKWKVRASRFSSQTAYKIDRKTQEIGTAFSPLPSNLSDTALTALLFNFRQSLYYNRFGGNLSVELTHHDQRNIQFIAGGTEGRSNIQQLMRIRWNMSSSITIQCELKNGEKKAQAELLANRNFNILFYELNPKIFWQPSTTFRFGLGYRAQKKDNIIPLVDSIINPVNDNAWLHRPAIEVKWNQANKGSIEGKFEYLYAQFSGQENTPLGFEMLESLGIGHNLTWGITIQRSLGKNLQLTLQYDGRKTENGPVIHLGSAQFRAFF